MTPTQKAEQEARAICAAIDKLHDDCIGRGFEAFNEGRFIRDQESLITSALLKARADAIEEAAKMCDFERREYEKSSKEFDRMGKIEQGTVECPDWNPDPKIQCGNGLHLSPTPQNALAYHNGKVLKCEVAVKDLVVFPSDITKVRCKRVTVVGAVS